MAARNRLIFWAGIAGLLFLMALWAFWPRAVDVDLVTVEEGPMSVEITEEGETRIHDVFEISAPVAGLLERINLEAGDCVYEDRTVVAVIKPAPAPILDARTEAQLTATVDAAEAAVSAARAEVARVQAELDRATADAARYRALIPSGAVPRQTLERAEADEAALGATLRASEAALAMRRQELAAARAALRPSGREAESELIDVIAPINGVLLRRLRQSEGPIAQGAPLLEVGDPEGIEIVAELLSEDAVRVSPGDRVTISDWGGPDLNARVRRVEPFAFTKVSALGIEEQRANVIIELVPGQTVSRLGHGYRVDVAIEVWAEDPVLKAPMTALFKQDQLWSVYRLEDGRARLRTIEVGQMNARVAQIRGGLEAGDRLVEHPSSRIADGVRIRARSAPTAPGDDVEVDSEADAELTAAWETEHGGCDFAIR